jgi:hypothetical protein
MLRLNIANIMWLFQNQIENKRNILNCRVLLFPRVSFPTNCAHAATDGRDGEEPQGKHHMVLFSRLSL